jgi:hypothetical protein
VATPAKLPYSLKERLIFGLPRGEIVQKKWPSLSASSSTIRLTRRVNQQRARLHQRKAAHAFAPGDRGFESRSLQRRVACEPSGADAPGERKPRIACLGRLHLVVRGSLALFSSGGSPHSPRPPRCAASTIPPSAKRAPTIRRQSSFRYRRAIGSPRCSTRRR